MFLRDREFRRLLKNAYKGGLILANHDGRIYMSGWGWEMDIKREYLPKTILAQIIELAGELPDEEERFSATKEGNQMELGTMEVSISDIGAMAEITKVAIITSCGAPMRVLKTKPFGKVVLLLENVIQMVSEKCIDNVKGEEVPAGPMYVEGEGIIWWNNIMRFKVMYRTVDESEQELVTQLEKIHLG